MATINLDNINLTSFLSLIVIPIIPILLYRWYNDPLRPIPGPFLAKHTRLWITILDLSGHRGTTVHVLHKKYGPTVRIAPNEVCFASPEAMRDIYSANSKNTKAPVYESFGFKATFTTRDVKQYREMKKRIVPAFSPSACAALEPVIQRQVENLIKCFDKRLDEPLDVLVWFRMLALSVVGTSETLCIPCRI